MAAQAIQLAIEESIGPLKEYTVVIAIDLDLWKISCMQLQDGME